MYVYIVSFQTPNQNHTRLSYTGPTIYKKYCFPPRGEFCELASRFKASHVKSLLWWIALRGHEASAQFPHEPGFQQIGLMCFGLSTTIPQKYAVCKYIVLSYWGS